MKRARCPNCKTYGIGEDDATALKNAKHESGCKYDIAPKVVKESKPKKSTKSTFSSDEE